MFDLDVERNKIISPINNQQINAILNPHSPPHSIKNIPEIFIKTHAMQHILYHRHATRAAYQHHFINGLNGQLTVDMQQVREIEQL